jgi:hypothetical protein
VIGIGCRSTTILLTRPSSYKGHRLEKKLKEYSFSRSVQSLEQKSVHASQACSSSECHAQHQKFPVQGTLKEYIWIFRKEALQEFSGTSNRFLI